MCVCLNCLVGTDSVTLWTATRQAPLWDFSGRNTSGLPFPAPGDLPNPGIQPVSPASPALQAVSLPTEPSGKPLSYSSRD